MMIFLCIVFILADRAIKLLAERGLAGSNMPGIEGFARLHLVHNTGASFSLFSGNTVMLTVVTGLLLAALAFALFSGKLRFSRCTQWGLLLMLSGGVGNWIDRAFFGCVTDYIEVTFVRFAVFNFADILVCIGAFLVCLGLFIAERKGGK